MGLYNDPLIVNRARVLAQRGRSQHEIAEELSISRKTVRKIFDPAFALKERERLRERDKARASRWEKDENYRLYQTEYGKKPERIRQIVETRRRSKATVKEKNED